jgi:hypothetical protein
MMEMKQDDAVYMMDNRPVTQLNFLWEPLAMIALGLLMIAFHPLNPLVQLITGIAGGILLVYAAIHVLLQCKITFRREGDPRRLPTRPLVSLRPEPLLQPTALQFPDERQFPCQP